MVSGWVDHDGEQQLTSHVRTLCSGTTYGDCERSVTLQRHSERYTIYGASSIRIRGTTGLRVGITGVVLIVSVEFSVESE